MDVFIKLEEKGAVFTQATDLTWLLKPSGDIQFRAVDLAHVYSSDQYCYAKTDQYFVNFVSTDSQLAIESTHKGVYYGITGPDKRWNYIFYLSIINGFTKEYLRTNTQGQNAKILRYFSSSLDKIDSDISKTRSFETSWTRIEEFVKSFGESNNLMNEAKEKITPSLKELASRIAQKKHHTHFALDEIKKQLKMGFDQRRSPPPKSPSSSSKTPPSSPKLSSSSPKKLRKKSEDDYENLNSLILQ